MMNADAKTTVEIVKEFIDIPVVGQLYYVSKHSENKEEGRWWVHSQYGWGFIPHGSIILCTDVWVTQKIHSISYGSTRNEIIERETLVNLNFVYDERVYENVQIYYPNWRKRLKEATPDQ